MKIAIQGGAASFHDIAASIYFNTEPEFVFCKTFKETCEKLKNGEVEYVAMAIENSIAGSILGNYHLIQQNQFKIIGDIWLRIEQNLIVLPGTQLKDIEVVRSHYMALSQCDDFLSQYNFTLEEFYDTADSAKYLEIDCKRRGQNIAAIASRKAAKIYQLELLAESIETVKENYTRFFILSNNRKEKIENPEKATISFHLPHKVGALADVLDLIVNNNVNLTKIQSLPILGKPNQYTFYCDCEWEHYQDWKRCIAINSIVDDLTILGEYKKGEMIHDYSESE